MSREDILRDAEAAARDEANPDFPEGASETSEDRRNGSQPPRLSQKHPPINGRRTIGEPPPLARSSDILGHFEADLRLAGLAGEERLAKLTYLALTSRVLPWDKVTNRPVSVIAKGTTSTGKSHATQTVLKFFPSSAYLDLGSMSKRYLLYADDNLSHRFIVVPEASGIVGDDEILTVLRTLLSEGRITHGTVEGEGKRTARRIEKEGPTGLLMTTTMASVDSEMETRCLSLTTDDSPEQTRRVFTTLADLEDEDISPVHFEAWHELQEWIQNDGENRVVIPYVEALALLMPTGATRLRRDFVSILCLIRAHAILHQVSRDRDERGRIVATPADYGAVAEIAGDLLAEGADARVSETIRETVEATRVILDAGVEYTSVRAIAAKLGIGQQATYDRVRRALFSGYLADAAKDGDRRKRIVLGASLPGSSEFLPSVESVELYLRTFSDDTSEDAKPEGKRDSKPSSDIPTSPSDEGSNGRLTHEQREHLKAERDRLMREQLAAQDTESRERDRALFAADEET
jgi:hypothetical protein